MSALIKAISFLLDILFKRDSLDDASWYDENPVGNKVNDKILKQILDISSQKFACRCGCQKGKKILLDEKFKEVILFLEQRFVGKKIVISSGHRCIIHNANVGGAKNSQHISYPIMAADITIKGISARNVYKALDKQFPVCGLGYYLNTKKGSEFIHCDSRDYTARWLRIDGSYRKISLKLLQKYSLV